MRSVNDRDNLSFGNNRWDTSQSLCVFTVHRLKLFPLKIFENSGPYKDQLVNGFFNSAFYSKIFRYVLDTFKAYEFTKSFGNHELTCYFSKKNYANQGNVSTTTKKSNKHSTENGETFAFSKDFGEFKTVNSRKLKTHYFYTLEQRQFKNDE